MTRKRHVLLCVLCMLMMFCSSAIQAQTASKQTRTTATATEGKKVSLKLNNVAMPAALKKFGKAAGVKVIFAYEDVEKYHVTVSLNKVSVAEALRTILKGTALTYEENGKFISIHKAKENKKSAAATTGKASGDVITYTGVVVDASGQPLPGVGIKLDGNPVAISDIIGSFTITTDGTSGILEFSYMGFEKQKKVIQGRMPMLKIAMKENSNDIDEVVVTGYQVLNKRELTSAVSTIKAEDVMRPDAISIDQMLEGQVPDMMYMVQSGESGVTPKLRIRGTSSLIGNREPLWVVDGIVVQDPVQISPEELNDPDYINRIGNAIAGLNPQDIDRLDVLKDAAATALYGSKAANGVIVITTKRGRVGKPQVRYNNSFTWKVRPRYSDRSVNVMNSKERMEFSRELINDGYQYSSSTSMVGYEGLLNQLYSGQMNYNEFQQQVNKLETQNTDWFDLLCHDSFSQQHTVSLSGGSEVNKYYASVGITDNDDVVNGTSNRRYTAMINFDTNFTKWLSATFDMKGNVSKREYYQTSLSPVDYAYTASRTIPAYTDNGEDYYYYTRMATSSKGYNYNILNELANSGTDQNTSSVTFDANFKLKLTNWLTGNLIGSYTAQNTNIDNYWGENTYYVAQLRGSEFGTTAPENSLLPQGGQLTVNNYRQNSYTLRAQLDANKFFGPDEIHNISGSVGYEMSSNKYDGYQNTTRGYYPTRGKSFVTGTDIDYYTSYAGWLADNTPTVTDNLSNSISVYASATYGYNRLFYLNANMRVDGSNKFGSESNHKFMPVWSVSGSFNFGELGFMKDISWLDFLSVKGSYGFQGNMIDTEYPVLIIQKNPMNAYYGEYTSTAKNNPNPNLQWERTNSSNIGLEASFFNHRLQFEGSLYFKRTKDAYMTKTISTVNGMESYVVNGGNISNDGFSVSLTAVPIKNKDWTWTLATTFSRTVNEVTTNPDGESYELSDFLNGTAIVKGQSVGTFYSYKFLGLSPADGGPMFDDYEDHWEDLAGLSKLDTYTRVLEASGSREPNMSGSFTSMLRWKFLRLNATFAYSLGAKTRLFGMFGNGSTTSGGARVTYAGEIHAEWNAHTDYLKRWRQSGDELTTDIPAIIGVGNDSYYKYIGHWSGALSDQGVQTIATSYWDMYDYSNLRVVSASYMKCSTLSLTAMLPEKWLKSTGLTRLEITLTGNNLFTIADSRLNGQTPIQGGFTSIQLSERPSFSCGMNIIF